MRKRLWQRDSVTAWEDGILAKMPHIKLRVACLQGCRWENNKTGHARVSHYAVSLPPIHTQKHSTHITQQLCMATKLQPSDSQTLQKEPKTRTEKGKKKCLVQNSGQFSFGLWFRFACFPPFQVFYLWFKQFEYDKYLFEDQQWIL